MISANNKWFSILWLAGFLNTACVQTTQYLYSDAGDVQLKKSQKHDFAYVRIRSDSTKQLLIIYGKLTHPHDGCQSDAQVVLTCLDRDGKTVFEKRLNMRHQSNHQRGWFGAGFRGQIELSKVSGTRLSLSIEDVACSCHR